MATIINLKENFFQSGKIEWIGLRNSKSREILQVESAELLLDHGLVGDKAGQKLAGKRQVTLIQAEYIPVMESLLNKNKITPETLRRNIVVSGINLSALLRKSLKINDAILEVTGNCPPCNKMEQALGFGAFNAMRNHGGVNAVVKKGGVIRIGDEIKVCMEKTTEDSSPQAKLL
jgi:MOSC domain-containing protein YiiM